MPLFKNCLVLICVVALHIAVAVPFFWASQPKALSQSSASVIKGTLVIAADPVARKAKPLDLKKEPIKKRPKKKVSKKPTTLKPKIALKKKPKYVAPPVVDLQADASQLEFEELSVISLQEQAMAPTTNNVAAERITPPNADATHLSNPRPHYPKLSKKLREEGVVLLEVLILADGSVGDVRVKKTSGFARLDKAALIAVKKWRYQPAKKGNTAIEYWYLQPLNFYLNLTN